MKKKILLAHGGGGQEMNELINGLIFRIFDNEILAQSNDSAILNLSGKIAFST
ncbi:MAG: hydrogenase expression/formation protein HypE, partial [Campylobacter sp.]|nr:hydrogenase expression/formation protein HypE [Campylobacter sp.]